MIFKFVDFHSVAAAKGCGAASHRVAGGRGGGGRRAFYGLHTPLQYAALTNQINRQSDHLVSHFAPSCCDVARRCLKQHGVARKLPEKTRRNTRVYSRTNAALIAAPLEQLNEALY